jgi:hypothetical protein
MAIDGFQVIHDPGELFGRCYNLGDHNQQSFFRRRSHVQSLVDLALE